MSAPRIVEAGLRASVAAYPEYTGEPYELGRLVAIREGRWTTYAIVADAASGPDDPSRPLQAQPGGGTSADLLLEHPHIRPLLRTRLTLVSCGHGLGGEVRPAPPPAPPLLLAAVDLCPASEVAAVTAGGGFLAPLVASPLCDDAVLTAAVRLAAEASGDPRAFVVQAGKELARLLRAEPARLTTILRGAL